MMCFILGGGFGIKILFELSIKNGDQNYERKTELLLMLLLVMIWVFCFSQVL